MVRTILNERPERVDTHKKHLESLTFNEKMLLKLCEILGHPYTVYVFIVIALIGLTQVTTLLGLITWFSQTFVQFVALAILQGGANFLNKHDSVRADEEYRRIVHQDREMDELFELVTKIYQKIK